MAKTATLLFESFSAKSKILACFIKQQWECQLTQGNKSELVKLVLFSLVGENKEQQVKSTIKMKQCTPS